MRRWIFLLGVAATFAFTPHSHAGSASGDDSVAGRQFVVVGPVVSKSSHRGPQRQPQQLVIQFWSWSAGSFQCTSTQIRQWWANAVVGFWNQKVWR